MTERRSDAAPQHLDAAEALDYLEGRLAAAREARVEAHLATACTTCRERLAALAALVGTMRADRSMPAPAAWVARARALYSPARVTEPGTGVIERVARLLFDSWTAPLQPAVRRALGETRRLKFQLDAQRLELEIEPEGDGLATVRGALAASDAPLWRLTLEAGDAPLASAPDARGAFAFARAPEPLRRLKLAGPAARYVVDLPAPPA